MAALILSSILPVTAADNGTINVPAVIVYCNGEDEIGQLVEAGLDIAGIDLINNVVTIIMHEYDKEYLEENNFTYEELNTDNLNSTTAKTPESLSIASTARTDYRTYEEVETELQDIANTYPEIAKLHVIGRSYEQRPMYALEISSALGIEDGRPESLYVATHHAREWPSTELAMDLARYLTDNYNEDARVTSIVNDIRVWIIPLANPDGFNYARTTYDMWRKTRSYDGIDDRGNPSYGADPNRNYGYKWGGAGASTLMRSDTYCGVKPFSESEMAAIRDFYLKRHIITTITGHTYGDLILYAWGYKGEKIKDQNIIDLAETYAGWNNATPQSAITLYPTTGDLVDWSYGALRSIAYCFELGYEDVGFHPPYGGITYDGLITDDSVLGILRAKAFGNRCETPVPINDATGSLVDCSYGYPEDYPEDMSGKIALVKRGQTAGAPSFTYNAKVQNAQNAGAAGVVIYNNTVGTVSTNLSIRGVTIPAIGINDADGQKLVEKLAAGQEISVEMKSQALTGVFPYSELWERNLPALLHSIEQSKVQSSLIFGAVTDKRTGQPVAAKLDMIHTNNYPLSRLDENGREQLIEETLNTSIKTDNGSYNWYVLPSEQPEIDSAPYTINISAPNRYEEQFELEILNFNETHELNAELQPYAEVLAPADSKESWNPNATIPFKFLIFDRDGNPTLMDNVSVKLVSQGNVAASFVEGNKPDSVRFDEETGCYIVNINGNKLQLEEGSYDVEIQFTDADGQVRTYMTELQIAANGTAKKAA